MERQGDKRRLATFLVADVVGYSRPMGEDESGTPVVLLDEIDDGVDSEQIKW